MDQVLLLVQEYVVENGLENIDAPEIHEVFDYSVSQAHTKIAEEYIHLHYTRRLKADSHIP